MIRKLKKHLGCYGVAIHDYVLNEIYRVEGCFIEWDESTAFDVAEYWVIKESLVNDIIDYCCHVGLFNKELRAKRGILSSIEIVNRYIDWSKKAKRNFKVPEFLLIIPEEQAKLPEEIPKVQEVSLRSKEKESKVKRSEGNDSPILPEYSNDLNPPVKDQKKGKEKSSGQKEKQNFHSFRESEYFDKEVFTNALASSKPPYGTADPDYYYDALLGGSDGKGYKYLDWLATAQTWIRGDIKKGQFVSIIKESKPFNQNGTPKTKHEAVTQHNSDQYNRLVGGGK